MAIAELPRASRTPEPARPGLRFERVFTREGVHPYDEIEWELRDAVIPGGEGGNVFEQKGVEVPKFWSMTATNVVASKYFRGKLGTPARETSVRQMIDRVVDTISRWGVEGGYFASVEDASVFADELRWLLVHQRLSFNSPVWFNIGVPGARQQASACFILSVEDSMDSILDWFKTEGVIFKGGSGSGINVSTLRSSREHLSGGGLASGPVSFMRGADSVAGSIKSGGTTRRAAKMVVLNADHPDVREFIWCKAREEKKAWALGEQGYDMSLNGEAWQSIQFQNANNSVRATDDFMRAALADEAWGLRAVSEPRVMETVKAHELLREISEAAWQCGDPGMQFDTTINDWHTIPNSGRINGSNPCFPGDARVHTTKGLVPIAELFERTKGGEDIRVYTHRATGHRGGEGVIASLPAAVMRNGTSPIVRLRFTNGGELRCTPNHRIWTSNRGWVEARDLTPSDRVRLNDVATPASEATWDLPVTVERLAIAGHRGEPRTYTALPTRWSEPFAEIVGYLSGDGCMTDDTTTWVYGQDDIADGLMGWHEGILTDLFGGVTHSRMANDTDQLRSGSGAVRELFAGVGVTTDRAPSKRVPDAVFTAPVHVQSAYLRGLYAADGCVSRVEEGKASRYVRLGSSSRRLLLGVQKLLSAFGIRARLYRVAPKAENARGFSYTKKDGTERRYVSADAFDLRIAGSDLERFADRIGFSNLYKQEALRSLIAEATRYRTKDDTRLVSREDDGQAVVYNLTEPVHHSYIVDGVLVANCSEYMSTDDSACNLASLNLTKFVGEDGEFDTELFARAVDVVFTAQEILVGFTEYPTPKITRNALSQRQLGLGYANLGALLMSRGLAYDSDEGRAYAAAITALMTGEAYAQSARVAAVVGPYEDYGKNREAHDRVMKMHRHHAYRIIGAPAPMVEAARRAWDDVIALGAESGFRNAQASVLAPTGTISFMMDCDTTGVEPDIALVKYKKLVGGGTLKLVNGTVPAALDRLGYTRSEAGAITTYIEQQGTIEGAPGLRPEDLPIFDCAFVAQNGTRSISHMGHIKMMGAVQPFISGAISKTVNLPETASVEDVMDAYVQAWKHGVKAIAIYRDGSKKTQPLSTKDSSSNQKVAEVIRETVLVARERRRLPDTRASLTHKFSIEGHEGYITVGLFEDGTPGELFVTMAKEGSTLSGMMDAFATSVSLLFQYGVPLQHLVEKFGHMRFEPAGWTGNSEIGFAKSIVDYVFRWLGYRFLSAEERQLLGLVRTSEIADPAPQLELLQKVVSAAPVTEAGPAPRRLNSTPDAPPCPRCGWLTVRNGTCHKCENCGETTGCS
ncbi:MAG TPA: LAGLIDADG family homing endonuclease [Candidatus Limnocylindria bacterium]|nr:LAGLIDADG family homing endonuclease [Candidatus Limnocylindria bacterium]